MMRLSHYSLWARVWTGWLLVSLCAARLSAQETPGEARITADITAELKADNTLAVVVLLTPQPGRRPMFALKLRHSADLGQLSVEALAAANPQALPFETLRHGNFWAIHWAPTPESSSQYRLAFTLSDPVAREVGADTLLWDVVSAAHDFPFSSVKLKLSVPGGRAAIAGQPVIHTAATHVATQTLPDGVSVAAEGLPARGYLRLELHLLPKTVRHRFNLTAFMNASGGGLLLFALPLLALLLLLWLYWLRGRDPQLDAAGVPASEPPESLPEIAGTILDEYTDGRDLVAAAVDLAQKGYLRFSFTSATDSAPAQLRVLGLKPLEGLPSWRRSLAELLTRAPAGQAAACLSRENLLPRSGIAVLQAEVQSAAAQSGFFRRSPEAERRWYRLAGLLLAAGGLFLVQSSMTAPWLFQAGWGVLLGALPFFLFAPLMPQRTLRGAKERARVFAYLAGLRQFDPAGLELDALQVKFEQALPYAVALRYRKEWINRCATAGACAPQWWRLEQSSDQQALKLSDNDQEFIDTLAILSLAFGEAPLEGSGG